MPNLQAHQHAVLLSVARCPDFMRNTPSQAHPGLRPILGVQAQLPVSHRQVPEPWRGSPAAPLLFIGSNPSINSQDDSPMASVPDAELVDYFNRGFDAQNFPRIAMPSTSGGWAWQTVRYWSAVRSVACQL